ncbi:hypothetical protein CAOG_06082, partial [Capsaspora owczarzaki ATCC 30864]|uniref:hypothetical protein n=1 Tax=Capsaspora owczarzaki (strain ATCC 30864) TaxID=595528 RepID=UPI0001FE697E
MMRFRDRRDLALNVLATAEQRRRVSLPFALPRTVAMTVALTVALLACLFDPSNADCTDLRIVEILNRPASTATQYIQLFNSNRLHAIALNGLTLGHVSGGTSEIMSSDVIIPPLGCALLGSNNGSSNGNVKLDHVWSTFSLASTTTETIQLSLYSTTCTSVSIGTGASSWPTSTQGTSYVIRDYNLAPTGSNWELSPSAWTGSLTNKGSPGVCQQFSMAATRAAIITEFTPVASASVRPRSYIKLFNSATVSLNLANVKLRDENSLVNSFTAAAVLPPMSCSLLSGSSSTTTNGNITGYIATYDSVWWLYDGDTVRLSAAITPAELIGQSVSFTTGWPSRGTYASYILKDYRNTGDTASLWRAGTVSWPGSNAWSGGNTGYGEPYQCPYVQQSACSTIVITEFMYNPDMIDSNEIPGEYIRVMNKGSSSVSMTGIDNIYGADFDNVIGFALTNSGMTITISIGQSGDANYEVCSSVTYGTSGAWPGSTTTNGKAFQLRDPTLDPASANSWILATTPVASTVGSNSGSPVCAARQAASAASSASKAVTSMASIASFASIAATSKASMASASVASAASTSLALAATAASKASTSVASVASSAARAASTSLALAATAASTSLASGASSASKAATSLASIASLSAKAASESSASVASVNNLDTRTFETSSELGVSSSNTEPVVSSSNAEPVA